METLRQILNHHHTPTKYNLRLTTSASYLQGGDDFIAHLLDRNHVAAGLRVDDAFLLFPAHHDGFLTMGRAAHLLFFALRGQCGVGVGRDHSGNWCEDKVERK